MADPTQPICIFRCDDITEAEMLKHAIEAEGIDITVDGAALNTTFGAISGPMISAVKLIVRREDAAEALELIEEIKESWAAPDQDAWYCEACHEEIDGGFQICWSCGGDRDEVAGEFPAMTDAIESEELADVDTAQLGRKTENPYESPRAMGVADEIPQEGLELTPAQRKRRVGLVLLTLMFLPAIIVTLAVLWGVITNFF